MDLIAWICVVSVPPLTQWNFNEKSCFCPFAAANEHRTEWQFPLDDYSTAMACQQWPQSTNIFISFNVHIIRRHHKFIIVHRKYKYMYIYPYSFPRYWLNSYVCDIRWRIRYSCSGIYVPHRYFCVSFASLCVRVRSSEWRRQHFHSERAYVTLTRFRHSASKHTLSSKFDVTKINFVDEIFPFSFDSVFIVITIHASFGRSVP